jgi:hypothetical protein
MGFPVAKTETMPVQTVRIVIGQTVRPDRERRGNLVHIENAVPQAKDRDAESAFSTTGLWSPVESTALLMRTGGPM